MQKIITINAIITLFLFFNTIGFSKIVDPNQSFIQQGGIVNAKVFGAKGDGITDDTQALNKALTNTGKVYLPEGEYYISSSLKPNSNITILGPGTIVTGKNHFFHAFHLTNVNNVIIDGVKIRAQSKNNGFDCAIKIDKSNNIEIRNTKINNIGKFGTDVEYGWGIFVSDHSNQIRIKNNTIKNIKGGGNNRGDFILLSHCNNIIIEENYMDSCQRQGIAVISYVDDFKIRNNVIKHSGAAGIDLEPHIDVSKYTLHNGIIENNRIESYGSKRPESIGIQFWAIDFHDGVENITFRNNVCVSGKNSTSHIYMINGARKLNIYNNVFEGKVKDAAIVTYAGGPATDWIIDNNTFLGLSGVCLEGWQCKNSTFSNNKLYGNNSATAIIITAPMNLKIQGNNIFNFTNGVFLNCSEANSSFLVDSNYIEFKNTGVSVEIPGNITINNSSVSRNTLKGKLANNGILLKETGNQRGTIKFVGNNISGVKSKFKKL